MLLVWDLLFFFLDTSYFKGYWFNKQYSILQGGKVYLLGKGVKYMATPGQSYFSMLCTETKEKMRQQRHLPPAHTFTRTNLNHWTNFSLHLVDTELYSSVHNQAALKSFILINWQVFMKYRACFQIPELFNLKNSLIINTEIAPLISIILHSPVHDLITKPDKISVINRKKR